MSEILGGVSIRRHSLPLDVAAVLAGRVRWLRAELPKLASEIGLGFPPVEVVPARWVVKLKTGEPGHPWGRLTSRPFEDVNIPIIQLTAPVLLFYPNDLIVGALAHEFLHYVFFVLEIARGLETGREVDLTKPGMFGDFGKYVRIDRELGLRVVPQAWLPPRLLHLMARCV